MHIEEVKSCFPVEYESRSANEIRYHGISFGLEGSDQTLNIAWNGENDSEKVNAIRLSFPT